MPITFKTTNIKIPQIARWRIAGVTDVRIAQLIGMTGSGLARILATQEYIDYEAAIMNGQLTEMDKALKGKVDAIREGCREAVPAALRCLVETVTQRRDMKAAFAAAKEILDRDPDRTLTTSQSNEAIAPGVPASVLDAAVIEGNTIAQNYDSDTSKKVN